MFPWVCLATMPLFYPFDWPIKLIKKYRKQKQNIKLIICRLNERNNCVCKLIENEHTGQENDHINQENENVRRENDHTKQENNKTSHGNVHTIHTKETRRENEFPKSGNYHTKQENEHYMRQENETMRQNNEQDDSKEDNKSENVKEITANNNLNEPIDNKQQENDLLTSNKDDLNKLEVSDFNSYNRKKRTVFLILIYVFLQAFLPYSHFITKVIGLIQIIKDISKSWFIHQIISIIEGGISKVR